MTGRPGSRLRWPVYLLGLALGALGGPRCARPRPPDVFLVTIHGLGAGERDVLPRPPERAGTLLEAVLTPSPLCLPAHATLLTGLPPSRHRARLDGWPLAPGLPTLAERFRGAGYVTGAFVGSARLGPGTGLERGFDHYDAPAGADPGPPVLPALRPGLAGVRAAQHWLAAEVPARRSAFLWIEIHDLERGRQVGSHQDLVQVVRELYRGLEALERPPPLVLITGDHGLDREGRHGLALSDEEILVPAWLEGPGLQVPAASGPLPLAALGEVLARGAGLPGPPAPVPAAAVETLLPLRDALALPLGRTGLDAPPTPLADPAPLHLPERPTPQADLAVAYRLLEEGRRALAASQAERARQRFTEALGVAPGAPAALLGRGAASLRLADLAAAARDFEELLAGARRLADPHLAALARLGLADARAAQAPRLLREAAVHPPLRALATLKLARLLDRDGRPGEAREALLGLLHAVPQEHEGRLELARLERAGGNLAGALEAARGALALKPYEQRSIHLVAAIWAQMGDGWEALQALQGALRLRPRDPEIHLALARLYLAYLRHDRAIESLEEALRIDPASRAVRLALATTLLEAGRHDEARARAREVLTAFPQDEEARRILGGAEPP